MPPAARAIALVELARPAVRFVSALLIAAA
jgi:hypothetical protein